MLESLQILQLVIGCLMFAAFGVWLYFNFRWHQQAEKNGASSPEPSQKATLTRYMKLIIIVLVIPNILLIFLTRGLS